jgi:fermentation-respiration switch protein FrsA (DUF1100 family)
LLAVLLAIWLIGSFGMEQWALHPRHWSLGPPPSANGWAYENVSFKDSAGLTLRGWWIPGTTQRTVIMVHGWTSSRREPMGRAGYLHAAGYNLLLFDLRGHGASDGNYTTIGWLEPDDVHAAVDYVRSRNSGPIALLGYSMGASTVVEEAARDPRVSAVVEDSGFDTLANVFGVYFKNMTLLPPIPFDRLVVAIGQWDLHFKIDAVRPVDEARQLRTPLLAIIGTADRTVPPGEGLELFHAVPGPKQLLLIPGAGHVGGYDTNRPLYERTVLAFLTAHLAAG